MKTKEITLQRFEFFSQMERGRKFEAEVQDEVSKISVGTSYNNVRADHMEFDIIVAEYPLMTFVEIKAYRSDFSRDRIKKALVKLVRNCVTVTEDSELCFKDWVPARAMYETTGNRRLLFNKLGLAVFEGWKFRMMMIVPDKSFDAIAEKIKGKRRYGGGSNLLDIGGFPLLVIPKRRIKNIF